MPQCEEEQQEEENAAAPAAAAAAAAKEKETETETENGNGDREAAVDDAEVEHAYRNARAMVCGSIAEGFGLPIVEALRHGQTVIASDLPIHREVGGAACDYFDLAGPEWLAAAVANHEHRHGRAAAARQRCQDPLTWGEAAPRLLAAVADVLGRRFLPFASPGRTAA